MSDELKIRRTELRAPDARPDIQKLYSDMESSVSEAHNHIRSLQTGRSLIADSPVRTPSHGSNYLSLDSSSNVVLNVYNGTLGVYQSVTLS